MQNETKEKLLKHINQQLKEEILVNSTRDYNYFKGLTVNIDKVVKLQIIRYDLMCDNNNKIQKLLEHLKYEDAVKVIDNAVYYDLSNEIWEDIYDNTYYELSKEIEEEL